MPSPEGVRNLDVLLLSSLSALFHSRTAPEEMLTSFPSTFPWWPMTSAVRCTVSPQICLDCHLVNDNRNHRVYAELSQAEPPCL